jgi:hypothetical protein
MTFVRRTSDRREGQSRPVSKTSQPKYPTNSCTEPQTVSWNIRWTDHQRTGGRISSLRSDHDRDHCLFFVMDRLPRHLSRMIVARSPQDNRSPISLRISENDNASKRIFNLLSDPYDQNAILSFTFRPRTSLACPRYLSHGTARTM